jgi:acylphosphatase
MTQAAQKRAHVYISGQVQGVGYRLTTTQKAKQAGVNGWVKNLSDGRVEAVFEGEADAVQKMVQWCREGPRSAKVDNVEVLTESPEGLSGFETRH